MKINPISSTCNTISYKGKVSRETTGFIQDIANNCFNNRSEQVSMYDSMSRVANVVDNLNTLMSRFAHSCRLSHIKSSKSDKYRFYLEHKTSNYKKPIKDIVFSNDKNSVEDIKKLEGLEDALYEVNPYIENSNFIIQRTESGLISDPDFIPDKNIIFIEDELIKRS